MFQDDEIAIVILPPGASADGVEVGFGNSNVREQYADELAKFSGRRVKRIIEKARKVDFPYALIVETESQEEEMAKIGAVIVLPPGTKADDVRFEWTDQEDARYLARHLLDTTGKLAAKIVEKTDSQGNIALIVETQI